MKIKAFKGLRPVKEKASSVACRPYDVLDSEEARTEAKDNPDSFLYIVKPEISLPPETDHYALEVYAAAKNNFQKLFNDGTFIQDTQDCVYIYELIRDSHAQTGIVACAAVEDYLNGKIKKHELTRPNKENDRKNHIRVSMLNAEPVFFAYKAVRRLDEIVADIKQDVPEYDFIADDGVQHRFWVITAQNTIDDIISEFETMPATYVADGHHRTAAAASVGEDLKNENANHIGNEAYNFFLAVHFPDTQLTIIDYNRVVKDLNGLEPAAFIDAVTESFTIKKIEPQQAKPKTLHEIGMYLDGNWYALSAKACTYDDNDPIDVLDVTILFEQLLKPVLDIHDLRTDERIDFVGGIRGLDELERRVDSGEMAVAFAMYPVTMQQLMAIADSGNTMPPKTTWFEPKLRSGLIVHSLEG